MSHPDPDRATTLDVDDNGRLVPRSEDQRRDHSAALQAALDEIAAIGPDDTDAPDLWDDAFRGIDAARPHRPLFGGHG